MAAIFSIRSASLKYPGKIRSAIFPAEQIDDVTLPLVHRGEPSFAGLRVGLKKVGRFVVKCLSDAATDSAMMWF
jgi:hypothetical protein